MPRTTLDLDAVVISLLRRRGRRQHKSMGQVASELLAVSLAADTATPSAPPLNWVAMELGMPRVDLEDREAVRIALADA